MNSDGKAVRQPNPINCLVDHRQQVDGRAILEENSPRDTDDLADQRFEVVSHESNLGRGAIANVPKLGFLEVSSNPEAAGIHQRQQLLALIDIGSGTGVHIRQVTMNRSEHLGVFEVEARCFQGWAAAALATEAA